MSPLKRQGNYLCKVQHYVKRGRRAVEGRFFYAHNHNLLLGVSEPFHRCLWRDVGPWYLFRCRCTHHARDDVWYLTGGGNRPPDCLMKP